MFRGSVVICLRDWIVLCLFSLYVFVSPLHIGFSKPLVVGLRVLIVLEVLTPSRIGVMVQEVAGGLVG